MEEEIKINNKKSFSEAEKIKKEFIKQFYEKEPFKNYIKGKIYI